jgi:hypothetical protein
MKKVLMFLIFALVLAGLLPAQEEDFSEGFGNFDEPIGTADTEEEGNDSNSSLPAIQIEAETGVRLFPVTGIESDDFFASPLDGLTRIDLSFSFSAADSEYFLKLGINPGSDIVNAEDIVDEAWFKFFDDNLVLQAGLLKPVWGKGDSFHVLDVLNGQDFNDFINSDSVDSKIAELMIKADLLFGMNGKLELAYVPFRAADSIPVSGMWVPAEMTTALETARNLLYNGPNGDDGLYAAAYAVIYGGLYTSVYNQAYAAAISGGAAPAAAAAIAEAAASDPSVSAMAAEQAAHQASSEADAMINNLLADQDQPDIADGQFGVRYTDSLGGFDFGLEYYYGFEKQPRLPDLSMLTSLDDIDSIEFSYPRFHLFGADAAFALGKFNVRTEAAYTLMEDRDLADSISYTAGVDISPGISNLNINLQSYGSYKMKDVSDRNTNRLALQLSDKWKRETIKPSLSAVYNIEDRDFLIKAELGWVLSDELEFELSWTIFEGDNGTDFGQFDDNDFVQLLFSYTR